MTKPAMGFLLFFSVLICGFSGAGAFATSPQALDTQKKQEREIEAVIRHKYFYKARRVEWDFMAGGMPYDSLLDTYMANGRVVWHITDHFGWEIIDFHKAFATTSTYTTNALVSPKNISNLQTYMFDMGIATGVLLSPLYGKVRFIGRQVLYFDIYLALALGGSSGLTMKYSTTVENGPVTTSILYNQWNPMLDFGIGLKVFMSDSIGLVLDFRDYVISAPMYEVVAGDGAKRVKHNFVASAGLVLFTPFF